MGQGDPELLESHEFLRDDLERWLEEKLLRSTAGESVEVVAERYVIGKADSPWSLKYLGVLSYLSRKGGWGEPVIQTPADAKSFVSNQRIKDLGFWHRGGKGHALDAIRHGILYMVRVRAVDDSSLLED
jgi:hypothetical protein